MSRCRFPERVLMTADTVGGVWTYAIELSSALGEHGIRVALATMGAPLSPIQWEEAGRVSNLTVFESEYKLEWMQDPWDDVAMAGDWLLRIEKDFDPDLVHLNGYAHGALPWRAPTLMVGHSCVLSWWQAVRGEVAPASWDRYRDEVSRGLDAASLVAAPTGAMLKSLGEHYGIEDNGRVIPNGRSPLASQSSAKEPFILTAGRIWDEAKNISALESISSRLAWPIYVAGEEKHPDGGEMECNELCRLGKLSSHELGGWYARASIYALPARYEPFGLTVLEAALARSALVLGDIPSLRETWDGAAVFVPPDDGYALDQALKNIIADDSYRADLACRAIERGMQFTPERMAAGYLNSYAELTAA